MGGTMSLAVKLGWEQAGRESSSSRKQWAVGKLQTCEVFKTLQVFITSQVLEAKRRAFIIIGKVFDL